VNVIDASHPGAIIFCLGLLEGAEPPEIAAAERLFADVIAGRRLDHALDTVLDSWATRRAARAPCHPQSIWMQTERERMMGRAWKRLADASPVERLRILNAQRLLIRRAGALVPASLLVLPPPVEFAPEDIPRTPRANAAWFQLMKRLPLLEVSADPAATRTLSMLVSRQGLDLARNSKAERCTLAAELHNYVSLTKRQPSSRTQPGALLKELARWRKGTTQMVAAWTAAGVAPGALSALEDFPLPTPPVDDSDHPTIRVRAIRSCKGLLLEGEQMRHCVAQRMHSALSGKVAIYSVEVDHQRLTVELIRLAEGWILGEVRGFADRLPSVTELRFIWASMRPTLGSPAPGWEGTLCPKGCGMLVPIGKCMRCRICGLTTGCR